jgi:predicted transcriptional regulator
MAISIPSSDDVRTLLLKLRQRDLRDVFEQTGVPVPTLVKIRQGTTRNPGIETVRSIYRAPALQCHITGAAEDEGAASA